MKTHIHYLLDQIIKRCPKSGRVVGVRRDTRVARILFPLVGLLAIGWFLLRTLPEPRRVEYPCQKVAAGIGAGFIAWLGTMLLTVTGLRFIRRRAGVVAAVAFVAVVVAGGYYSLGLSQATSNAPAAPAKRPFPTDPQVFISPEGANKPIGEGKGIFPGRVVWDQNFNAAKWDGKTGNWWDDANVDQTVVDEMFSKSLQTLTGTKTDAAAWDKLFQNFNATHGRAGHGYQKGEKIVIKCNLNADDKPGVWVDAGHPSPQVAYAMVRQLIEVAGVPGDCITLTDPSRFIKDPLVSKIKANTGVEFQNVKVADKVGGAEPWRSAAKPDTNSAVHFQMPDGKDLALFLPRDFTDATYLIDYAVVRPHRVFGITMSFKNHFGSVYDPDQKMFSPSKLHAFALWDYPAPYKRGNYHCLVPLLGHKNVGGKTLLYFAEGLYTAPNQGAKVVRWSTLGNRWFSSLLMSQDPVALDSVGLDLISTEPDLTTQPDGRPNPSFNGNQDGYLHEAALANHPPSGATYTDGDGVTLKSLGTHEHWNNAKDKQYSRNLGKNAGIELVRIGETAALKEVVEKLK
jgi:uncharacterized protein (DUF362 family)